MCDYSDAYIIVKGTVILLLNVPDPNNNAYNKNWLLKIMRHSLTTFPKWYSGAIGDIKYSIRGLKSLDYKIKITGK